MTESLPAIGDRFLREVDPRSIRRKNLLNRLNGSTLLGRAIARIGHCRITRGERGMLLADHYRFGFPAGGAFTVGSVAITAGDWPQLLADRPSLIRHEEWHSFQYARVGGLPFLPLYAGALVWSKLTTGDYWSRNWFERQAGLDIGSYTENTLRPALRMFARTGRG
ncbi:hypothetical protein [Calidifontibacter terrae]